MVEVMTHEGLLRGEDLGGLRRFLGVAYAEPPVGEGRFAPARPVAGWTGARDATAFAPHAPQPTTGLAAMMGAPPETDEARCLALNVWTTAPAGEAQPVMVWVHGGSYLTGGTRSTWYDGERLARRGVVVVTVQYRLGVLGFTHFAGSLGDEFAGSGNLGVTDVREALAWVQRNIGAFGGDPHRVTVFGESAGGGVLGVLLADEASRGLFSRAILQSPAPFDRLAPADRSAELAGELLSILEVPADPAALRALPVERLVEARDQLAARHPGGLISQPVTDGVVVAREPVESLAAGVARDVELLSGTNRDEWGLWLWMDPASFEMSEDAMLTDLRHFVAGDPAAAAAIYRAQLKDPAPAFVHAAARTDAIFRVPLLRCVDAHLAAGGRAFQYLFAWPSERREGSIGAMHAIEIPFVFDTLDAPGGTFLTGRGAPRELAGHMNAAWARFATTGDPSVEGLGEWPPYDSVRRATMVLDSTSRVEDDPLGATRRLMMP